MLHHNPPTDEQLSNANDKTFTSHLNLCSHERMDDHPFSLFVIVFVGYACDGLETPENSNPTTDGNGKHRSLSQITTAHPTSSDQNITVDVNSDERLRRMAQTLPCENRAFQ